MRGWRRSFALLLWFAVPAAAQSAAELGDTDAPAPSAADLGSTKGVTEPEPTSPRRSRPAATRAPAAPVAPTMTDDEARLAGLKLLERCKHELEREPADVVALERTLATPIADGSLSLVPELKPTWRLCKLRLAVIKKDPTAETLLADAKAAIDAVRGPSRRALTAQLKVRHGELLENDIAWNAPRCGGRLGFSKLAAAESKVLRDAVKAAASKYHQAAEAGDVFWARRAAFNTARLYERFSTLIASTPDNLRLFHVVNPFNVGRADQATLVSPLEDGRLGVERLYQEVAAAIDSRQPDPVLVEVLRARQPSAAVPPASQSIENPFLNDETDGILRFHQRLERRTGGRFVPALVDKADKAPRIAELQEFARAPGGVRHAYALIALSELQVVIEDETLLAALSHSDVRTRVAALVAIERMPRADLSSAVVNAYLTAAPAERTAPFANGQLALFGQASRALYALRAITEKDRTVAESILADERLPLEERLWIVAGNIDKKAASRLSSYVWNNNSTIAARALFALYLAQGRDALPALRSNTSGDVGCVSAGIAALTSR